MSMSNYLKVILAIPGLIYESVGDIETSMDVYRKSGISRAPIKTIEKIIRYKSKIGDSDIGGT